jgi:hypothetical protein
LKEKKRKKKANTIVARKEKEEEKHYSFLVPRASMKETLYLKNVFGRCHKKFS